MSCQKRVSQTCFLSPSSAFQASVKRRRRGKRKEVLLNFYSHEEPTSSKLRLRLVTALRLISTCSQFSSSKFGSDGAPPPNVLRNSANMTCSLLSVLFLSGKWSLVVDGLTNLSHVQQLHRSSFQQIREQASVLRSRYLFCVINVAGDGCDDPFPCKLHISFYSPSLLSFLFFSSTA